MAATIKSLEATCGRVFAADQSRLLFGFSPAAAKTLTNDFGFRAAEFLSVDMPHWTLREGTIAMSSKRKLNVAVVVGNAIELAVTARGALGHEGRATGDARDGLNEIWSKLGELAQEDGAIEAELGSWVQHTTAVVVLPGLLERCFPGLARTREFAASRDLTLDVRGSFRVQQAVPVLAHGLPAERAFVIEPRRAAKADDDVYWTQSPLSSEEHVAWLNLLAG